MKLEEYETLDKVLVMLEQSKGDTKKVDEAISKLGDVLGEASDSGLEY